MTDLMHTFAWAIVNGDGFLLADGYTGRAYIYSEEAHAQHVHAELATNEDLHVTAIACVPVEEDSVEDLLG